MYKRTFFNLWQSDKGTLRPDAKKFSQILCNQELTWSIGLRVSEPWLKMTCAKRLRDRETFVLH